MENNPLNLSASQKEQGLLPTGRDKTIKLCALFVKHIYSLLVKSTRSLNPFQGSQTRDFTRNQEIAT